MDNDQEGHRPGGQISRRANDLRGRYAALDARLDKLDAALTAAAPQPLIAP